MAYTPGTLHAKWLLPNGDPVADADPTAKKGTPRNRGTWLRIQPDAPRVKDPTDGTVVLSGHVDATFTGGVATVTGLPPSSGMNPDPLTYTVSVYVEGAEVPVVLTGVEITAGGTTELASWVSVVPAASVPNVQVQLQGQAAGLMAEVDADAGTAFRQQQDARLSATYAQLVAGGHGVVRYAVTGSPFDPDITLYAADGVTEL